MSDPGSPLHFAPQDEVLPPLTERHTRPFWRPDRTPCVAATLGFDPVPDTPLQLLAASGPWLALDRAGGGDEGTINTGC